jgi:hypothetical protein
VDTVKGRLFQVSLFYLDIQRSCHWEKIWHYGVTVPSLSGLSDEKFSAAEKSLPVSALAGAARSADEFSSLRICFEI